jgi:hypothetical protein
MTAKRGQVEGVAGPLQREDWDFCSVPDNEVYACQWWEYARESARIRAFYNPAGSDFFQSVGMAPERQRPNRTTKIEAHRHLVDPIRVQFARFLREYALPVNQTMQRAREHGIAAEALDYPWQCLPSDLRRAVLEDLAPYSTKMPCLTFLPFNRCSDLRDLGIADEDYRCAQLDQQTGIERFRAQVEWAEFTDSQIVEAFRVWVKENRPLGVGHSDQRGKRNSGGLDARLHWVGILRLMSAIPFTRAQTLRPDAWKRYRTMDWPRARQNAGRTFRHLFFFLPEIDRPMHWPTAGRRAK